MNFFKFTAQISTGAIQWFGAFFISLGHVLNTLGSDYHRDFWNIFAFAIGTVAFLLWSLRVENRAQVLVCIISLVAMAIGLYSHF
jgi:hypothetical protein